MFITSSQSKPGSAGSEPAIVDHAAKKWAAFGSFKFEHQTLRSPSNVIITLNIYIYIYLAGRAWQNHPFPIGINKSLVNLELAANREQVSFQWYYAVAAGGCFGLLEP